MRSAATGKAFINKVLNGWPRTGPTTTGVRKAAKMHQFGHQAGENAAIKRIVVFDHDVTTMAPLNISCRDSIPVHALAAGSGGFLVATAQQG
jgi:hypothetical protein